MEHRTLPVFLCLDQRPCLVVGGGKVACRKVEWLLESGAKVEVIAPAPEASLERLAQERPDDLVIIQDEFGGPLSGDTLGRFQLVIAATDNDKVNRTVHSAAVTAGVLVNVVDCPELCTFFVPAVLKRGGLQIAIGTGGDSPALAGRVKRELEVLYPETYAVYLKALGPVREEIKTRLPDAVKRKAILSHLAENESFNRLRGMTLEEMGIELHKTIDRFLKHGI